MLKLKIGSEVILTVNVEQLIQDCLINAKTGNIWHVEFAQGSVCVKFSKEKAGFKAMKSPDLSRKRFWICYEQYETKVSVKKR